MKNSNIIAALAGTGLIASFSAHADVLTFSDSIVTHPTTWSDSFSVSRFNPALGTLTGISYRFAGNVAGDARAESLDPAPALISLDLKATISVERPNGGILSSVIPVVNNTFNASVYDGVNDFGGTSGVSYLGLLGSEVRTGTVDMADWSHWIGLGDVSLASSAVGLSEGSGAGNLLQLFNTDAGADFSVTYQYDAAVVPEPGTIAMSALVLLGAIGVWRHRRNQQV